jgi:hypothetical protein
MSGSRPKAQKINPYQGIDSSPLVGEAQQALGINKIKKPKHMQKINSWIENKIYTDTYKDDYWYQAAGDVVGDDYKEEGYYASAHQLDQINSRAYDYKLQADTDEQNEMLIQQGVEYAEQMEKQNKANAKTLKKSTNQQIRAGRKTNNQTLRQNKKLANKQSKDLAARDAANQAQMESAAESQRAFMEEMMNQPVLMPRQQSLPTVQKPMPKQNQIMPAPAAPAPMNIGAPPAPELTESSNRMAIVRTPKSTRARQRRATRGTSRLTN